MSLNRNQSFFGKNSPLGGLTGAGILIIGSARLSWAIAISGCLLWVYGLTSFSYTLLTFINEKKIIPCKGRRYFFICLASFWSSIYMFVFWLLCPLAAFEIFFILVLMPLYYVVSGIIDEIPSSLDNVNVDTFDHVSEAVSQAGILSALLIAVSILREPFSYCCLTFPGSYQGMITIMYFNSNSFFPVGIFATSSGALLIIGYIISFYQFGKSFIYPGEKL